MVAGLVSTPLQPNAPAPTTTVAPLAPSSISGNADGNAYTFRPHFKNKFRPDVVHSIIRSVLQERLTGAVYHQDSCAQLTRELADEIKNKLKDLNLERYKYVVVVTLGEMRGEGVRMNCRCFWDADADNLAQDVFTNDSLFCSAVAFGVFYY